MPMPPDPQRNASASGQWLLCACLSLVVLVAAFFLAEVVFRLKNNIPLTLAPHGLYLDDDALGWRVKPHYQETKQSRDCAGQPFPLHFSTTVGGFREYGSPDAARKLLIVGDSFTLNREVSDGQTYSAALGRLHGCDVFTSGSGGYGSLQEYRILMENLDTIKPDAILIQIHTNDIVNNDFTLEKQSVINNNFHARPYLAPDDTIVTQTPSYHWTQALLGGIGRLLGNRSSIISSIQHNLQLALYAKYKDTSVERSLEDGQTLPAYTHSLATTRRIFETICAASGATPVYAFSLGGGRVATDIAQALHGTCITMLGDVSDAVFAQKNDEPARLAADCGHLSAYGNTWLAQAVYERLQPFGASLFQRRPSPQAAPAGQGDRGKPSP